MASSVSPTYARHGRVHYSSWWHRLCLLHTHGMVEYIITRDGTKCSIDVAVAWCVVADASVCTNTQVRKNLTCSDRVETPFYSCGNFDLVCVHCATSKDLVSGEEARDILPACSSCYKTCPKAFKRKQRLFSPPDSSAKAAKNWFFVYIQLYCDLSYEVIPIKNIAASMYFCSNYAWETMNLLCMA